MNCYSGSGRAKELLKIEFINGFCCSRTLTLNSGNFSPRNVPTPNVYQSKKSPLENRIKLPLLKPDQRPISEVDPVIVKYTKMLNDMLPGRTQEVDHETHFGSVRFDTENQLKFHGQYERRDDNIGQKMLRILEQNPGQQSSNMKVVLASFGVNAKGPISNNYNRDNRFAKKKSEDNSRDGDKQSGQNYVDEMYFGTDASLKANISTDQVTKPNDVHFDDTSAIDFRVNKRDTADLNYIDQQVMHSYIASKESSESLEETLNSSHVSNHEIQDINDLNYVDEVFFKDSAKNFESNSHSSESSGEMKGDFEWAITSHESETERYTIKNCESENLEKYTIEKSSVGSDNIYVSESSESKVVTNKLSPNLSETKSVFRSSPQINNQVNLENTEISEKMPPRLRAKAQTEAAIGSEPPAKTAYDYALKIRKETDNLKKFQVSSGNEIFGYKQILKVLYDVREQQMTKYDMVQFLKKSILYDNHDIIGLYKPYGLSSQQGSGTHLALTEYLEDLAGELKCDKLFPIHRLDIQTTGVMLLSRTQEMADTLKKMFAERRVVKTYWAITKGIPSPLQGIINIPIAEGTIEGRSRMVLRPDVDGFRGPAGSSKLAITKYQVMFHANGASLVELTPSTGVKHQIRVHLGFGLGCPVLGDHKYSHLKKMVPQKLSSDMLDHLVVTQSRVRDLPLFLHARSVILPEIAEGTNVIIQAGIPSAFNTALKMLKLNTKGNKVKPHEYELKSGERVNSYGM